MQFIDLKTQYSELKHKIDKRVSSVLSHGHYIMGPEVGELEQKLSEYVGSDHCVSCANGTDAIQLALMALGIGPEDAVIVPSFTFFATAEAVSIVGADPVFADIDAVTFNIDPSSIENVIETYLKSGKKRLKAIMAVDLFGLPADYGRLQEIAKKHQLFLIEDGAQGFGGTFNKQKACSFGDIATTSFFPAKPLGCYGDGGAVFTSNGELANRLRSLRVHGKGSDKYDNVRIGLNSRLDTIQAAILLEKLDAFDKELDNRQVLANQYIEALAGTFDVPSVADEYTSSWAQFTLKTADEHERNNIRNKLSENGIPTAVYYPKPVHLSAAYSADLVTYADLSVSEEMSKRVFSIPMHPYLGAAEQNLIIKSMAESIG